ncbi:hypothetical protein PAHAL_1G062300 [Panicum hallii]|uniref:Uncharacterized protein n=1 Tax=Panicum hallii TaxID=206008 RepID=A0A2T8KU90_9POAL|nr:hypothetical protein PAHAL_1G062300 [Panicum hallii]
MEATRATPYARPLGGGRAVSRPHGRCSPPRRDPWPPVGMAALGWSGAARATAGPCHWAAAVCYACCRESDAQLWWTRTSLRVLGLGRRPRPPLHVFTPSWPPSCVIASAAPLTAPPVVAPGLAPLARRLPQS